jgi:hypothetical protein
MVSGCKSSPRRTTCRPERRTCCSRSSLASINEATQLYVVCAELCGPRARVVPRQNPEPVKTFAQLQPESGARVGGWMPRTPYGSVPLRTAVRVADGSRKDGVAFKAMRRSLGRRHIASWRLVVALDLVEHCGDLRARGDLPGAGAVQAVGMIPRCWRALTLSSSPTSATMSPF